jgi:hypothetical protein
MARHIRRAPLVAAALLMMVWSAWLGLVRMGWALPLPSATHVLLHGPLFVNGFFGTLITLERAVALGRAWGFAGPMLSVAGAVLLVAGHVGPGALAMTAASGVLVIASAIFTARQPALFAVVMSTGAVVWFGGNLLWLAGSPVPHVVYWWTAFLVLTIAGERLELSRLLRPAAGVRAWFGLAVLLVMAGLAVIFVAPDAGVRLMGTGLVALAAWLLRHDVARRTMRLQGLPRFMAICLLTGYVWLVAGGLMAVAFGHAAAGPRYDAMLHAVLLGFVMSMVFAHAPIIFPGILGMPLPFRRAFYLHLVLLHASLAVRIAGDLLPDFALRRWGGLLNGAALLLFVANTSRSVLLARLEDAGGRS